jgi:hypothetical protein
MTGLLVAALLLFGWTGDALGQHACPHHSAVPGAAAHAPAYVGGHAGHAGHHGQHSGHGRDDSAPQVEGDHGPASGGEHPHDACTCVGSCPSAAAGAFPADPDAGLRVVPAWVRQARAGAAPVVPLLLLPFVLPYGQAPPLLG